MLGTWYRETLGVGAGCSVDGAPADGAGDSWYWMTRGGPVVFAPFAADSDYFSKDKAFMLNLRVRDLDAMCDRLSARGIAIERRAEWDSPETGRFARIHDPEGNPIELWEPPAEA